MGNKKDFVVLSLDPGKVNCGYSIIRYRNGKYLLLRCGMVKNTITDMKGDFKKQISAFLIELNNHLKKSIGGKGGLKFAVAERFMARGTTGQITGECVSFMLGLLALKYINPGFRSVTASAWKNQANRYFPMVTKYVKVRKTKKNPKGKKEVKKPLEGVYLTCGVKSHVIDAVLIGMYSIDKYLDTDSFKALRSKKNLLRFIKTIEEKECE